MAEETKKNRSATVGIDKFYYAVLQSDTEESVVYEKEVRLPFVQNVNIETEQEIAKAFGDNKVAEMAVSTGVSTVEFQFHALPLEDRVALLGLEDEDGLVIQRSQVNPPYVAVVLEKTKGDGSAELVGLTKGMFTLPPTEAQTKEDSLEFGSDTISGEFSSRVYDDAAQVFAHVKKGDETIRQKFMNKVFRPAEQAEQGGVEG
ncbi:major tail protein [Virgibacillus pantothenticus]|uniref:major tail protein n=1 Tax=Virgibacillus pantothenticus TaxID=1473 RepID=UPI00067C7B25|nr:major tail protein [Virgibacillus pantothenticus]MED3738979.1 phage tail protein [Virgibacillus pantothenticus]QTY15480.1 phage tail protein [Virgibacillus pantothenticus]SIT16528.1 phage major tail protein, phi13 family [Virgibacillus pantothenticus]